MSREANEGQLASQNALREVLEYFPQHSLVYAFGYGSGVFSQSLNDKHEGMLDIILVVDDAKQFHEENMTYNPSHYPSWLKITGAGIASRTQRNFPLNDARVFFQVVDAPVPMKYGIVHKDDLVQDLTLWDSLYLAGRLHKPTLPVLADTPDEILEALSQNLQSAVAAALLLFPEEEHEKPIEWSSLYRQIARLSYSGDFRTTIGAEHPQKISKLVDAPGQLGRFQSLYEPVLQPMQEIGLLSTSASHLEWNGSDQSARKALIQKLPPKVQGYNNADHLAKLLAAIVAPAARHQSFKGVFTLGFRKSITYATAKLQKGLFRKR